MKVKVIGAGLAGSEAAWQLANRGIEVALYEMKPKKMTPAHHSEDFAELVCSNSLRGDRLENAVGLLKEELRRCGSLILACADATRVEAGGCLAVDRGGFSRMVTEKIRNHPNITVISEEITEVPEGPVIVATGPLTSDALSEAIGHYFGETGYLHFFDAEAAPVGQHHISGALVDGGFLDVVLPVQVGLQHICPVQRHAHSADVHPHPSPAFM